MSSVIFSESMSGRQRDNECPSLSLCLAASETKTTMPAVTRYLNTRNYIGVLILILYGLNIIRSVFAFSLQVQ